MNIIKLILIIDQRNLDQILNIYYLLIKQKRIINSVIKSLVTLFLNNEDSLHLNFYNNLKWGIITTNTLEPLNARFSFLDYKAQARQVHNYPLSPPPIPLNWQNDKIG